MNSRLFYLVMLLFTISSIHSQSHSCFYSSATNLEASPGENVCVKINIHNYENIVGMQYTLNWDSLVLAFTETKDYGLPGISPGNFGTGLVSGGVLTFSWADPSFMGSNQPDRTHAYSVCFDVIGAVNDESGVDFTSSHTPIEIVDGNFEPIEFNGINGEVLVRGIPTGGEKLRSGFCIVDPSCLNNEIGAVRSAVEGGQDPITMSWEGPDGFTSSDFDLDNIGPGTYYVTIADGVGFSRTDSIIVKDLVPRLTDAVVKDVKCFGQQNGSINITVEAGTPSYTYSWSTGAAFEDLSGLAPGSYSVTFTDSLGCTGDASFDIEEPDALQLDGLTLTCPGLGEAKGQANVNVSGGVMPYVYFWTTGDQTSDPFLGGLAAGDFGVSVTDSNNCPFVTDEFTLEDGIDSMQAMYFTCGGSDIPLTIMAPNAINYSWQPASLLSCTDCADPIINTTMDTMVTVTVETATGCTQTESLTIITDDECVWPGDANNDGIANYLDVLWLGLANGATGPERTVQTTSWIGLGSEDWTSQTPVSMVNYKFIDADGNGLIDEDDIDPIIQNYDLEHNFIPPALIGLNRDDVPPIFIEVADTVLHEELLNLDLILGSSTDAIASAYGLGFKLGYDQDLIDLSTFELTFDGWLGNDLWEVQMNMVQEGILEVGVTRIDGQPMSGAGKIGTLTLEFKTVSVPTPTSFTFQDVYLINESEGTIAVLSQTAETIIIDEFPSSLLELDPNAFYETISPNPFESQLVVKSERQIDAFEILNLGGQLIQKGALNDNLITTNEEMPSGLYLLRLIGEEGITSHRLIK